MFAKAKLADTTDRVKPDRPRQRETRFAESTIRNLRRRAGCHTNLTTSNTPTARCGPACRVLCGEPIRGVAYPTGFLSRGPRVAALVGGLSAANINRTEQIAVGNRLRLHQRLHFLHLVFVKGGHSSYFGRWHTKFSLDHV